MAPSRSDKDDDCLFPPSSLWLLYDITTSSSSRERDAMANTNEASLSSRESDAMAPSRSDKDDDCLSLPSSLWLLLLLLLS